MDHGSVAVREDGRLAEAVAIADGLDRVGVLVDAGRREEARMPDLDRDAGLKQDDDAAIRLGQPPQNRDVLAETDAEAAARSASTSIEPTHCRKTTGSLNSAPPLRCRCDAGLTRNCRPCELAIR